MLLNLLQTSLAFDGVVVFAFRPGQGFRVRFRGFSEYTLAVGSAAQGVTQQGFLDSLKSST
jgi:hypothetical protein